ncbi:MAG: hypothetical protein JKY34_16315, partial [Kordiimonadaceae bacterium]|nr:hypothetical protein [Kordiimonadaceae bacterium]
VSDVNGVITTTHDNTRTYIPFGGVVKQPRADELETANLSHLPDGHHVIAYDKNQTGVLCP